MFSVFSDKMKPSAKIELLKKLAGAEYNRLLFDDLEDEKLWILKPKAIDVMIWANKKILFELPNLSPNTVGVRLRIVTGMLNNLEKDNIIPKEISILYHDRLVRRVYSIFSEIMTEDLPF
jgi:hypothetical protein